MRDDDPDPIRRIGGKYDRPPQDDPKPPATWPEVARMALGVVALLAILTTVVLLVKL